MINIYHWLREEKPQTRMILQVYYEIVFDAVAEDVDTGRNWLQAH